MTSTHVQKSGAIKVELVHVPSALVLLVESLRQASGGHHCDMKCEGSHFGVHMWIPSSLTDLSLCVHVSLHRLIDDMKAKYVWEATLTVPMQIRGRKRAACRFLPRS